MGSTTTLGYPYPVGTDRLMDGDDAIKALAEKVDSSLGVTAAGTTNVSTTNSATGTTVVTLPAGRFATGPRIACNIRDSTTFIIGTGPVSASSFTVTIRHYQGTLTTATVAVEWIARTNG